jgi:hypothetical protein
LWLSAYSVLKTLNLSIHHTHLSYILSGDISLQHLYNITSTLPHCPHLSIRLLSTFAKNGYAFLHQLGYWSYSSHSSFPSSFTPFNLTFQKTYLTHDWPIISSWLLFLSSFLPYISHPEPLFLLPNSTQQHFAENCIKRIANLPLLSTPYPAPPHFFTSNGSKVILPHNHLSVTCAVFGNGHVFPLSLHSFRRAADIYLAEAYGILVALLLARQSSHSLSSPPIIYTDHLNSLNLLSNPLRTTPQALFLHPARSLYRWILKVISGTAKEVEDGVSIAGIDEEVLVPSTHPSLSYVRAHTDYDTVPSQLNRLVDHITSHSHQHRWTIPTAPLPTFTMDEFMLYTPIFGFFDSSISLFVKNGLANLNLPSPHPSVISFDLYDQYPPPDYPYT